MTDFKATGSADLLQQIADLPEEMLEPTQRLEKLVRAEVVNKQFSELTSVTYHHDGATLAGHALLDALETHGFMLDDFDAVGAMTTAGIPLVTAMIHAAASRGQILDGFLMDFVFPGIKGPSIAGKRVILVDAWLSEKSFVQTSSVVTLTHGNELNVDFAVLENEGAQICAITSLVGSVGGHGESMHGEDHVCQCGNGGCGNSDSCCGGGCDHDHASQELEIQLVNPVSGYVTSVPFIPVFSDKDVQSDGVQGEDVHEA